MSAPAPPPTVVNVDDNPTARLALTLALRTEGFAVREAGTGPEALRLAAEQPDVVLLDVHLGDGPDGVEVCRRLKADPATALIPVLLISGVAVRGEDRVRGLEGGADGYLTKPVEPGVVVAQVRALLRAHRAEQRAHAARTEAQEARARLAAIVESSQDAVVGWTLDGTVTSWNRAAEQLYGWAEGEALGQPIPRFIPPDRAGEAAAFVERLRRGERVPPFETVRVRKDGALVDVSVAVSPVRDGGGRVVGAATIARDITARKQAEHELRRERELLRAVLENVGEGVVACDADGRVTFANHYALEAGALRHMPASVEEWAEHFRLYAPDNPVPLPADQFPLRRILRGERLRNLEMVFATADGARHDILVSGAPLTDPSGRRAGAVAVVVDVTERKKLEEQYRQAQKMEAVGRLAGGVAHDFNNLLTVINGYADLVLAGLGPDDGNRALVGEVRRAGERAAALTRQLLAFSRRELVAPRTLDLDAVVRDVESMLRRVIGEDVRLVNRLGARRPVLIDPGQLDQVLLNLAVNARDAMPTGGTLTIETRDVDLDEATAHAHGDVRPGAYVLLAVSDTGTGMTAEVRARLFEPFFTTKGPGKGTGLGLATVYGIVRGAGGHIEVESEPGRGARFELYFPQAAEPARKSTSQLLPPPPRRGHETVLLCEDEDGVRALVRHVLNEHGYTVLEAAGGAEALRVAEAHPGPIHLLLTDVVMPEMGGRQLAERLAGAHPEARVLYLSGYTDDEVVRHGVLQEQVHFLPKPFTPAALAQKVREVLDAVPPD